MRKFLSGILASSLILSMGTVSFATETAEIFGETAVRTDTLGTAVTPDPTEFTFANGTIHSYTGGATSIIIPESIYGMAVTSVGNLNAPQLESVQLHDGITTIGNGAFSKSNLRSIVLPDSVTFIAQKAFEHCGELVSVKLSENLVHIDDHAFQYCTSLTSIVFPDSLSIIDSESFQACTSLKEIQWPSTPFSIGIRAFQYCTGLETLLIPGYLDESKYKNGIFQHCSSLKQVYIEDGITDLGSNAFEGCSSLVSLRLPETLSALSSSMFQDCSSLAHVYIPDSVRTTGTYTFKNCSPDLTFYGSLTSKAPQLAASMSVPYIEGNAPVISWNESTTPSLPADTSNKTALPSTAKVMVNGAAVNFGAYEIEGFNYFKLTDMAYAIDGTSCQFEVTWDAEKFAINMVTGSPHKHLGNEMQGNSGKNEVAELFSSAVYKNGEAIEVLVYTINGSSYFQLDTLKGVLGIDVGWDGATSTITINS